MRKTKKILIVLVVILLLAVLVLCGVAVALWFGGQKSLEVSGNGPQLPTQEMQENLPPSAESMPPEESVPPAEENGNFVEYDGVRYRYNENMVNILLMGVDSYLEMDRVNEEQHLADVFVLVALDLKANKMSLIALPRDIMCDIELRDDAGEVVRMVNAQLSYAYGYGSGGHNSCELARETVSNIFYGLPIHGYAAYYLSGVEELNDAVGGVTVKVIADVPFDKLGGGESMQDGAVVTLTGKQARLYVGARAKDRLNANDLRMNRQKQYMLALISKAKDMVFDNPVAIPELYGAVAEYITTDLDLGEIMYLGTKAAGMQFDQDIRKVTGELIYNEVNHYAELYVDRQALSELMIEVFYTPVA